MRGSLSVLVGVKFWELNCSTRPRRASARASAAPENAGEGYESSGNMRDRQEDTGEGFGSSGNLRGWQDNAGEKFESLEI